MNKPAVGWPDVDHSRKPLGWVPPPNLMPPVAAGWSPGTRRNASEAESILSEAVAWWDPTISGFRDGDRWLRNSGTAGGLLDLRLGSSVVANTNDPKWLGPEDRGYVYLTNVAGNYLSVPDEAALRVTGDLDLRLLMTADDWTPSSTKQVLNKSHTSGNYSYALVLETSGKLTLYWSANGTASLLATSSVATGVTDGGAKWIRVTLDVDNGAAGRDIKFWLSDDDVTWTQLGTTVTQAGTTSIYAGTNPVGIGGFPAATTDVWLGRIYRAIVKDGIDGTTVLDVDCDAITSGSATSFTATTGQTVTINRSTSGRKSVAVPARRLGGRACFLFGTDDYMEVVDNWQHQLLNFGQGDSFTVLAAVRQWATPLNYRIFIGKMNALLPYEGYGIYSLATNLRPEGQLYDTNQNNARPQTTVNFTAGTPQLLSFRVARDSRTATVGYGSTIGAAVSTASVVETRNRLPFRIARASNDTTYQEFELIGAAVFRRALTTREIAVLSTYYSGG